MSSKLIPLVEDNPSDERRLAPVAKTLGMARHERSWPELLLADSPSDATLVLQELRRMGRHIDHEHVETAEAMRSALEREPWDVVIAEWALSAFSAPAALGILKQMALDLPFVIVSGTTGEDTAVEAMSAGAHDYVLKNKLWRLTPALERELRDCEERVARRLAERALRESESRFRRLADHLEATEAAKVRAEDALRESEQQLRQAQKMDAVGRLVGGVAHDFNNVLTVILSYGELILDDLKPADPLRADVEEICAAASRATGLVNQLMMFSRHQVVEPKVIDLHAVVTSMDKMLQRIVGEDVEMLLVAPDDGGRVVADPSHMEQVILNLVVNARDAMPTGGKLTIETANVVIGVEHALSHQPANVGPHVMLSVTDTGTGMDRETQARIFEPFFTTKELGRGTGLGLSTVCGIVQQSGGSMWVHSKPGQGTTFKIYLPRVDTELHVPEPNIAPAALRGTETILLVEDNAQVRTIVHSSLGRQGYHVISAQSGDEAVVLCEQHPEKIDLLITDVVMPHMSGPKLASRLVALRPEMKVLCISGYTVDTILRHGVLATEVLFLQKPVTPAAIARKVREIFDAPPRT